MKKIKGLIVLFFILIFLQFILWVQSPSEVIVSFLKYYSCSIYLFCIVLLLVVKDVDSLLYTFYVLAFGVFIMSRVFLDALGFEDAYFYVSTWANDWSYFSLSIQFEMLNSIIFYLLFSFVGFLSSCLFVDRYNYKMCVKNDSLIFEIRRLGFFLFISFCVPYLLYLYQAVKFVVENGYLAVYLNESSTTVDNPILRISDDLCVAGIYLYLSTFPIGKKYILVSCFYIFTLLILLGTGGRSATFTQVLAFLVYLGIRGIRVNWRWMLRFVLIGFSLIYVAQLVNDFRDSIPLSNVYICLKDRRVIAISDEKGVFSLEKYDSLSLNYTLYFSHINYLHKKLSYGDLIKNRCTVFLKENNRVLEEVSIFSNRHLNRFLHYEILSPLKRGVYSFASVLVDGQIYIVGGSTSCGPFQSNIRSTLFWEKYSNMMYRYDIKQDKWETIRHKFRERAYHTAGYYDGKIFILGGKRLSETRIVDYLDNAIEIYDIKRDTVWTDYTNPHQATLLGSVVYKDNMIVLGSVKKVLQILLQ